MGNSSSGFNKTFVTNHNRSNKDTKRPHSVLGISDDNNRINIKSAILRSNNQNHKHMRPPGMQLPPLPRSHSFHQVLRPTENGQILAAKGTIRGLEFNKPISKNVKIHDELNAILNSRRCKSETDLATDNSSSNDSNDSNDSNRSESSNYDENNKRKDNNNLRKSSASNGVAAKIHRAKYKAPQPPTLLTNSQLVSDSNYENNVFNDSHKKSAKNFGHNFSNTNADNVNNGLIRKLSDKSFNRLSTDDNSRLLIIPRLRLSSQQSKDPALNSSATSNIINSSPNNGIPSRYQSRNLIFDSKASNIEGSNPVLRTDTKQDFRKLRRSTSNCDNDINSKTKGENAFNDKVFKTKPYLNREVRNISDNPFFKQLNSLSSEDLFPELINHNNNSNNNKYFDKIDYYNSNEYYSDRRNKNSKNKIESPALPPAFDDNFILRRSTPTAGLNEQKCNFFYNKQTQQNDKSNKNKSINNNSKRAINPWIEDQNNSHQSSPPPPPPLPTDEIIRPLKSYNLRQSQNTSSPPPPPPIHNFDYEFDISSANNYKSIRTNVSDSANYSDEDEEEIKVILRPQLPPLKRGQMSDMRRERILLSEDLFNLKPFNHRNHCWTPLHDLSTSDDDDDGINSGNHSDDSIQKCDKPLDINNSNSYDTRFTLKNQLRTLIHKNKLKQQNMFSY